VKPDVNLVRLFAMLYCGTIACIVCFRHAGQFAWLKLTRPYPKPALILGLWPAPALSNGQFHGAGAGFVACLALASAVVAPRVWLATSVGFYFLYFGPIASLSWVQRKIYAMPQILLLLAAAPGVDGNLHTPAPTWPLLAIQALLAQGYLTSAVSKVRSCGIRWASWRQLQGILLHHDLTYDLPLASLAARSPWICGFLGGGVLAFELTFWVVLVTPKIAPVYAITGLLFHVCARILIKIDYLTYHAPAYLVFALVPAAGIPDFAVMVWRRILI